MCNLWLSLDTFVISYRITCNTFMICSYIPVSSFVGSRHKILQNVEQPALCGIFHFSLTL